MKQYKDSLTLELAENLLIKKLGKEFYNDIGNLVTAKHEAEYFLEHLLDKFDDFECYKSFDSFLNYELENYIDGYATVSDYISYFCPICRTVWDEMLEDCGHYTATMIKYYRLKNGWSIRDLAKKLGYKYHNTVAAWENGSRKPKLASIKKLAKVFGVSYINLIR